MPQLKQGCGVGKLPCLSLLGLHEYQAAISGTMAALQHALGKLLCRLPCVQSAGLVRFILDACWLLMVLHVNKVIPGHALRCL